MFSTPVTNLLLCGVTGYGLQLLTTALKLITIFIIHVTVNYALKIINVFENYSTICPKEIHVPVSVRI